MHANLDCDDNHKRLKFDSPEFLRYDSFQELLRQPDLSVPIPGNGQRNERQWSGQKGSDAE